MSLALGQTLDDRYLLEAHIGSGGMARVFRAKNLRTGKAVAVKEIYLPANEQAETLRHWLRREIKALMVLDHPNVVQLIDHGEAADGTPWVVTELLEGSNLEEAITQTGPMPATAVVEVATQVMSALKTAHALSIVHRDLKPGNLFLCNSGRVVVLDFGLARAVSGEVSATLAEGFGTKIMGTPQYWSPEQIRGVSLDIKSDIFSMGGTLFYLLVGKPPFPGSTPFEIASQIMMKKRTALAQAAPATPRKLATLVERMLEEETSARPSSPEIEAELATLATTADKPALMSFLAKKKGTPLPQVEPASAPEMVTSISHAPSEHTVTNVRGEVADSTRVVTAVPSAAPPKKRSPAPLVALALIVVAGLGTAFVLRGPAKVTAPTPEPAQQQAPSPLPPPTDAPDVPPPIAEPTPEPKPELKPRPEPQGLGTLSVSLKQWAEVTIDGENQGRKQIGAKFPLPSGKHELLFKNAKFPERRATVIIKPNKETQLKLDFESPPN